MKDPYSVLGVSSSASDKEIKEAYRALDRKYNPDNYDDDNPLKELANEKMQEVNAAYDQIQKMRSKKKKSNSFGIGSLGSNNFGSNNDGSDNFGSNNSGNNNGDYVKIRQAINARRFAEAERDLNSIPVSERGADWHYLISVVLARRGNVNDAMRELEIACDMDPGNTEYQRAKEMFNTNARGYGSTYYGGGNGGYNRRSSTDDACDCCANLICLDCLCECMGGDLIRCI